MNKKTRSLDYKDQSRLIRAIGLFLLIAGILFGFLGILEIYTFYLFSEGGRFYYQGFGFGSFMFGNIASQVIGYHLLAVLFFTLGYGHLLVRKWARTLSIVLLGSWRVIGAPLSILVFFLLMASKDPSLPIALLAIVLLALSYLLFPGLFIRWYQGTNVRRTFELKDPKSYYIDAIPAPIIVLSSLYFFYIIILYILTMFNGIFPVFGTFLFGMPGIICIGLSIAFFSCLIFGTLHLKPWAWWGSVIWLCLFTISTVLTFGSYSYSALLSGLAFPIREIEFLKAIPANGYHFALLAGIPLLITIIIAIRARPHFMMGD